jgi:TolB-like protein
MKRFTCVVIALFLVAAPAGAGERVSVLVLPFDAASSDVQWAGKAVQQNLVAELSASRDISAIAGARATTSPEDAASIARPAGAQYAILGGVQANQGEMRVTGFVVDVKAAQTIGVLKATGGARDVFALQDQIAAQARAALPVPLVAQMVAFESSPPPAEGAVTRPATTTTAPAGGYANRIERGIARIEQSGDRLRELEGEIDRLTARLRELERDNDRSPPPYLATRYYDDVYYDDYYPYPYFGSYYYAPFVSFFPNNCRPHVSHRGHGHRGNFHSGTGFRGSFNGRNASGNVRVGGGVVGGRAVGGGMKGGGGVRGGGGRR